MKSRLTLLSLFLGACALQAQTNPANPGDPLPGLSAADLQLFQAGRLEFVKPYPAPAPGPDGILPRASTVTCSGCHPSSAIGGSDSAFDLNWGRRTSTPLFGAGLIEGIPDEVILALQNRPEALSLGIRGRAAIVPDRSTGRLRVGRFGWKAQHATLLDASAENLAKYIGVPENISRSENPDPSTGLRAVDRLAVFSRMLAPVGRISGVAVDPTDPGEPIFSAIGCPICHTRTFTTSPPNVAANPIQIAPFSDFLLHDVGTGDGIAEGAALPNEMRTPPLWGLRLRRFLLHDGSAATLDAAIRAHKGEATIVRQRYEALTPTHRQALLAFLMTL